MRDSSNAPFTWVLSCLSLSVFVAVGGCSRTKYRLQADRDAYHAIGERNCDPRWRAPSFGIEMDPRSRYFEPCDPDRLPMPLDDPVSNQYMQCVDGMTGWKHWHRNGDRIDLENPQWYAALSEYVDVTDRGAVQLDVDTALRLAYVHSPYHQRQLETLYLSALDVSAERFRLDTQFFGGYDARYVHNGSLVPPGLTYSPLLKRYIVTPAIDVESLENNRLTVGRPSGADPALLAQKRFATAGELLVGFANSFVFEFTGGDANLTASLANFSLIQPLLRGAGKDVALEQLTLEERDLLANLRAYGQFRQGFYTQVAIGELGVTGPQRSGSSTSLQSYPGQGGVGGYLGLLQQLQEIRNSEDNLALQIRTLDRLEALYNNELIDLVQVDQFRQSVESQRSELLVRQNAFELALDRYKTGTLGLPPDLPIDLNESLIAQFQLIPRESSTVQNSLLQLQERLGRLPADPPVDVMNGVLADCFQSVDAVKQLFDTARIDMARMDEVAPTREQSMTPEEKERFQEDRKQLHEKLVELETGERGFGVAVTNLQSFREDLNDQTRAETLRGVTAWVGKFLQMVERLSLVPAQARLEVITVDAVDLDPQKAFRIALANRLDFMNGRAALVDRWRAIQVNADALQSVLNVTASGDIHTARNNPVSFRAPAGNLRMGVEFDAPFTRLLERNAYRESLIQFEQSRRDFIQSRDSLHLGLRAAIRNLEQLRQNLEIQRRAVTIAMRRVDQTQLELTQPRPPAQPGVRPAINPTTAINLLSAQSSLQNTQNAFLATWLSYYANRMRLSRELGTMMLDPSGRWIERPIEEVGEGDANPEAGSDVEELPVPSVIPGVWGEARNNAASASL